MKHFHAKLFDRREAEVKEEKTTKLLSLKKGGFEKNMLLSLTRFTSCFGNRETFFPLYRGSKRFFMFAELYCLSVDLNHSEVHSIRILLCFQSYLNHFVNIEFRKRAGWEALSLPACAVLQIRLFWWWKKILKRVQTLFWPIKTNDKLVILKLPFHFKLQRTRTIQNWTQKQMSQLNWS